MSGPGPFEPRLSFALLGTGLLGPWLLIGSQAGGETFGVGSSVCTIARAQKEPARSFILVLGDEPLRHRFGRRELFGAWCKPVADTSSHRGCNSNTSCCLQQMSSSFRGVIGRLQSTPVTRTNLWLPELKRNGSWFFPPSFVLHCRIWDCLSCFGEGGAFQRVHL